MNQSGTQSRDTSVEMNKPHYFTHHRSYLSKETMAN